VFLHFTDYRVRCLLSLTVRHARLRQKYVTKQTKRFHLLFRGKRILFRAIVTGLSWIRTLLSKEPPEEICEPVIEHLSKQLFEPVFK
jgi:hypothetical protein